ncbi:hypothetical protein V5799_009172 [Amblyomma americanum]|uniref:Neurotransmitter-gated ion-channel transmembrane domain-containing protein n=1 Tax=Amblyomma americanum TaxID=6943 RepID=A0AAQ4FB23_AMBAM
MGYFLIQVYVPCILIVVLSWVSFWINREATADRVGLGITTVLTLSTFGLDTRTDLPKVPYPTSLDWFVIMCFSFVIFTLLEFAGVHYFTKVGSGEFPLTEDEGEPTQQDAAPGDSDVEEEENAELFIPLESIEECTCRIRKVKGAPCVLTLSSYSSCHFLALHLSSHSTLLSSITLPPTLALAGTNQECEPVAESESPVRRAPDRFLGYAPPPPPRPKHHQHRVRPLDEEQRLRAGLHRGRHRQRRRRHNCCSQFINCMLGNERFRDEMRRRADRGATVNSVSQIDKVSRVLFPFSFILINLFYWFSSGRDRPVGWDVQDNS